MGLPSAGTAFAREDVNDCSTNGRNSPARGLHSIPQDRARRATLAKSVPLRSAEVLENQKRYVHHVCIRLLLTSWAKQSIRLRMFAFHQPTAAGALAILSEWMFSHLPPISQPP